MTGEVVDKYEKFVPKNKPFWADAEVIALAKVENRVVVTQEEFHPNPKPKNIKIPNICEDLGVECVKLLRVIKDASPPELENKTLTRI